MLDILCKFLGGDKRVEKLGTILTVISPHAPPSMLSILNAFQRGILR
jgi:hypothetical protein